MIETVAVLVLLSLFVFLLVRSHTTWTRTSQERQRRSNLLFLARAHTLALGHEPEQPEGGDLLRSTVKLRGLGECVVETTATRDLKRPVVFLLRVPRSSLDLPDDLHFEVVVLSKVPPPGVSSNDHFIRRAKPDGTRVAVTWGAHRFEGPMTPLLGQAIPEAHEWLAAQDPSGLRPVTRITLDGSWLVIERAMLTDTFGRLEGDLTHNLSDLIKDTAKFARTFHTHWETPEAMWEAILDVTTHDAPYRTRLFGILLDFSGTPAAERAWRHALDHGDLDDMLLAIHHDRVRAVAELSTHRLITLANTLTEATDAFHTHALPELVAQRFPFDVLLDARLTWTVRKTLLEHWLDAPGAHDPELLECVRQMHTRLEPGPRKDLEALLTARPEVALQGRLSLSHDEGTRGALSAAAEAGALSATDDEPA